MPHRQANEQPREGYARDSGSVLDVHSVFLTVQGEGPFTGMRAVFVRLAGCNLQCPGCDTQYTVGRTLMKREYLYEVILNCHLPACPNGDMPLVVITGGEPLRQRIGAFVQGLLTRGYRVQIESNGMFPPDVILSRELREGCATGRLALIVSPKTPKIAPECAQYATAFKYVIDSRFVQNDGLPLFALENVVISKGRQLPVARPPVGRPVYLTPYDSGCPEQDEKNRAAVVASCIRHGYVAGLQIHKILNVA